MVESDYDDVACLASQTYDMLAIVSDLKGWVIEQSWEDNIPVEQWGAVRKLESNWQRFQQGEHKPIRKKDRRKLLLEDWESDEA